MTVRQGLATEDFTSANASVYLFGEFNSGYSQYPDDYANSIFQSFSANAKSTTQIAIHRDGNLMYYGYIRKLQGKKYLGLCVVLNGMMLKRFDRLFSLFEEIISNLVSSGQLIHFDERGNLVTNVDKLYLCHKDIEDLTDSLRNGFEKLKYSCSVLPPVNYAVVNGSSKSFIVNDDKQEIIKSSYTNSYTYVYKSEGYDAPQLNSYQGIIQKNYEEKQKLQTAFDSLKKEHAKTLRQQKQYKFVFLLFVVLVGCAIGLFFLNSNLAQTQSQLSEANTTIEQQKKNINENAKKISSLQSRNNELDTKRKAEEEKRIQSEDELNELQKKITTRQPFFIKETSFDFSTGYLSFHYYSMVEESVNIEVRAYGNNGESYINSSTIYVNKGDNYESIYLSRSLDGSEYYSFEILKGYVIIGGDRH